MNQMREIRLAGVESPGRSLPGSRGGPKRAHARRAMRLAGLALVVSAYAIAGYLLFQSVFYRGLVRSLGEWQFAQLGGFFPAITCTILLLLFSLPLLALLLLLKRQQRALERDRSMLVRSVEDVARLRRILTAVSVTMLLGSMACIGLTPFLPDGGGRSRTIVVGGTSGLVPAEGRSRLVGQVDVEHVARFSRRALFLREDMLVAPVRAPGGSEGAVRFFVEIAPDAGADHLSPLPQEGVLRRNGLPGEVVMLFRSGGVPVASEHYLLYRSARAVRWPYYQLALQLALAALLLGVASWMEDRRYRRLAEMLDKARAVPIKV